VNRQARAILWAQFRSIRNHMPRSNKGGLIFTIIVSGLWFGMWAMLALVAMKVLSSPGEIKSLGSWFSGGLLLMFLYWQVIPVLMAATGASLDIKKLQVYPIPHTQLFAIEVLLRTTTGLEMLLILAGVAAGLLLNPLVPGWAPLAILPYIAFNLCLAAGLREILARLFARKRVREIAVFLLVLCGALPQLLVLGGGNRMRHDFRGYDSIYLPWGATAAIAQGNATVPSVLTLLAWAGLAYVFGRWQFERGLHFDVDAARATTQPGPRSKPSKLDAFFSWPSMLFRDPLGALVEKELRFLTRAPRFRLVFTMGFTFGLVIWLPIAARGGATTGIMAQNYLTLVCVYALLLLGDVCFWNTLGFDRRAAQLYFVAPIRFQTVLIAKNIAALFFVLLEITAIIAVCSLLRMPVTPLRLTEAYSVTLVITIYLVSVGNLTSVRNPRAVNPEKSTRSAAGRMQALLLLIYPFAALPVLLAYAARYAFESEAAFFAVLSLAAGIGAVVYWVAMESSVTAADIRREDIVNTLSQGDGLIQG
jgi:ABC-2 type transport system permease protein